MTTTPHSALILSTLTSVDPERLLRGTEAYTTGAYTITVTYSSDAEIRAYVANGDTKTYGVTLAPTLVTCSCPDGQYRAIPCKHSVALAWHILKSPQPAVDAPACTLPRGEVNVPVVVASPVHLQWRDGITCCGTVSPPRAIQWPWNSVHLSAPDVCTDCVTIRAAGFDNYHLTHKAA